jgi:DNA-binding transcriptional regulator YdaS (Cro superfamily)
MDMSFQQKRAAIAALERAAKIVGSAKDLVKVIGVSRRTYYHWRSTGIIPPDKCKSIEVATGGKILASTLRPDLF